MQEETKSGIKGSSWEAGIVYESEKSKERKYRCVFLDVGPDL